MKPIAVSDPVACAGNVGAGGDACAGNVGAGIQTEGRAVCGGSVDGSVPSVSNCTTTASTACTVISDVAVCAAAPAHHRGEPEAR